MDALAPKLPANEDELYALLNTQARHYQGLLAEREQVLRARDATIERLREQINVLLARRYGASAETVSEAQLALFNEAELEAGQEAEEAPQSTEVAPHRRAKPKRLPLPEHLPRIVIEHPLPESERLCPHHGIALERFAEVTSEQLDIVPAKVRVLRHVRGKYRCACCSGHLRTAPMPPQLLAKSIASPGLLAYVATAKFVDGLPLYHQQQQFARIGFDVSRTTLAVWTVRLGQQVQPLINLLRDELLARRYVLMDETTLQVLKEQGKTAESKSYLWAQMSGEGAAPIVLFEYDPTRSREVPKRLLEGFCGTLHTDGYAGYDAVVTEHGLTRLYCWVHVRRRFVEVLKSLGLNPKKLPDKPPPKARRALKAIGFIKTLYTIERRIADKPPDERLRVRQAESVPVLAKLRAWLDETRPKIVPSSKLGDALAYLDNHWAGLVRYCEAGHYGMDTNAVENAIRPFCVGRRRWLFCDTVAGAQSSANLYSLVVSAKANGLDPHAYLRHVFTELPKAATVDDIEALLPTRLDPSLLQPDTALTSL
jgi:transposase